MENTVDGKCLSQPEGWEDLSRLIQVYEKLGKEVIVRLCISTSST